MTEDAGKTIMLTGAPLSNSLDWAEESLCCPLQRCFGEHAEAKAIVGSPSVARPAWRNLPFKVEHLPSGLTQLAQLGDNAEGETQETNKETSFLTVTDISVLSDATNDCLSQNIQSSGSNDDDALTQFYEHSYAVHEELPTSNVFSLDMSNENSTFPNDVLERSSVKVRDAEHITQKAAQGKPRSLNITNLRNIPNPSVLQGLGASTMTVDLVVGILAISPRRLIKTKKYSRLVELVEMTVADDTKSGFGITIWLPVMQSNSTRIPQEDALRSGVTGSRPQDIVLARNIALDAFRGKVYGQSLRKGITKLDLLYRRTVDSHDEPGAYSWEELDSGIDDPQLIKVKRVREWVMSFVGGDWGRPVNNDEKMNRSCQRGQPALPADTQ